MNIHRGFLYTFLLATAGAFGFSQAAWAQQQVRIGISVPGDINYSPADVAEKLGYFKEAGLDAQLIVFRGGAAAQEALSANVIDLMTGSAPAVGLAVSKGEKEKAVATIAAGYLGWQVLVPTASPIRELKDLKDKKMAITTKGSASDAIALWIKDYAHVEFQEVPIGMMATLPAMHDGQVDAIVGSNSVVDPEIALGKARSILDVNAVMPPTSADVIVARQDLIDKNPELIRASVAAFFKAAVYMKANPVFTKTFFGNFVRVNDPKVLDRFFTEFLALSDTGRTDKRWVINGLSVAAKAWDSPDLAKLDPELVFTNEFIAGSKARH